MLTYPFFGGVGAGAFVISVEKVTATFNTPTTTQTINLTKGQDYTQCVPLGHGTTAGSSDRFAREDDFFFDIELVDNGGTPAVTLTRTTGTSFGGVDVVVYIVEFGSDISVTQKAFDIVSSSKTDVVATTVGDDNYTFYVAANLTSDPSLNPGRGHLKLSYSGGNVTVETEIAQTTGGIQGHFWAVEDTTGGLHFNKQVVTFSNPAAGWANTTTCTSVDTDRAMLLLGGNPNTPSAASEGNDAVIAARLSSATQPQVYRNDTGSTCEGNIQVVEFQDTDITVQHVFHTWGDSDSTANKTITAVTDYTNGVVCRSDNIGWWHGDTTGSSFDIRMGKVLVKPEMTSSTNLRLTRESGTTAVTPDTSGGWQVIDFSALLV